MTWQAGRWSIQVGSAWLPDEWGTLRGFSVSMGRSAGEIGYLGAVCSIEFENGSAWTDYSADGQPNQLTDLDPVHRGDGLAIRWAPPGVTWPKGPPVIFAGWIVSADIAYTPDADGGTLVTATATAEDQLAIATRQHTDVDSIGNATAFQIVRDHCRGGSGGGRDETAHPMVRLSTWGTEGGVSGDVDHWAQLSQMDLIGKAMEAVGGELWVRHGERLEPAPAVPPVDPPNRWWIPRPEIVARPVGGHSTRDAPSIVYVPEGTNAAQGYSGAPITRRYQIDLQSAEVTVRSPAILDRVELTSRWDNHTAVATPSFTPAANRQEMIRNGVLDPGPTLDADRSHLTTAADRFLRFNSQAFRHVEVRLPDLADDEITYWAPIGIGDEISLPTRYRLSAIHGADPDRVPFIAQVRSVGWEVAPDSTDLILGVAHYPGALSLLTATLTVGYNNLSVYGYAGPGGPGYGTITDHEFTAFDGTPVVIIGVLDNYSGDETLQLHLETEIQADAVDGMWLVIDGQGYPIRDAYRTAPHNRKLFTWPGRQPGWRLGDTVQVEITAEQPQQIAPYAPYSYTLSAGEIWHSRIAVGRAGSTDVYGVLVGMGQQTDQRWGALIDGGTFTHGGGNRSIRRIEYDADAGPSEPAHLWQQTITTGSFGSDRDGWHSDRTPQIGAITGPANTDGSVEIAYDSDGNTATTRAIFRDHSDQRITVDVPDTTERNALSGTWWSFAGEDAFEVTDSMRFSGGLRLPDTATGITAAWADGTEVEVTVYAADPGTLPTPAGDNWRIDLDSAASAQACEGLWLQLDGPQGPVVALTAARRNGTSFAWQGATSWTRAQFTSAGLYTAAPVERVHRATITVGHGSGWDGWQTGQYGSIESGGDSLFYNGLAITLTSVRYHDTSDTMRITCHFQQGQAALTGLWMRMGNIVQELTSDLLDNFGWGWDPHHDPNWTTTGHTVDFELWTGDPTGL